MTEVDFVARLADAWDGRGTHALRPVEQLALLRLADLPGGYVGKSWSNMGPAIREKLVFGARLGVDLGRMCAWCFGS